MGASSDPLCELFPTRVQAIIALYEHPSNDFTSPTSITGAMVKTPVTGVDRNTSFTLNFSNSKLAAQAILSCSINLNPPESGVTIRFERGTIRVKVPIYCPKEFTVEYHNNKGALVREERRVFEYVGGGWHFQADEVARSVRDGKKESSLWGHNKSLLEMEIFDEVGWFVYRGVRWADSVWLRFVARADTSTQQGLSNLSEIRIRTGGIQIHGQSLYGHFQSELCSIYINCVSRRYHCPVISPAGD